MSTKSINWTTVAAVGLLALLSTMASGQSLPPSNAKLFLCLPERFWTCDGIGRCDSDDRPETLAAWKIDVATPRYSMCRRDGSECGDWQPLIQGVDIGFLVVLHENSWNPETFKIERLSGKFAAVRISGGSSARI